MYGKTIAFGMVLVTMDLDQKKESGENSKTRMNLTEKQYTFLVTPKQHLFEFLVNHAFKVGLWTLVEGHR